MLSNVVSCFVKPVSVSAATLPTSVSARHTRHGDPTYQRSYPIHLELEHGASPSPDGMRPLEFDSNAPPRSTSPASVPSGECEHAEETRLAAERPSHASDHARSFACYSLIGHRNAADSSAQ